MRDKGGKKSFKHPFLPSGPKKMQQMGFLTENLRDAQQLLYMSSPQDDTHRVPSSSGERHEL
jgi:hypothetical protein